MLTDLVRDGADVYTSDPPDGEWEVQIERFFSDRVHERMSSTHPAETLFFGHSIDDESGTIEQATFDRLVEIAPDLPLGQLARWNEEGCWPPLIRHEVPSNFVDRNGNRDPRLERYLPPLTVYVFTGRPSRR